MAESLRQKRCRFTAQLARLIEHARSIGYEVAIEEAKRSDEQACIHALGVGGRAALQQHLRTVEAFQPLAHAVENNRGSGIRNSLHELGLAVDLNLYRDIDGDGDRDYLDKTEQHRPLGEWWEAQGTDHRWGGRFGDGNHYSIEHEGRR